jgi:hypothetical protein
MRRDELLLLVGEIKESQVVLKNIHELYVSYSPMFLDEDKRDIRDAVLLTEIFCNSYTCLETILFRISRVFENHLSAQQWHKELLRKMIIEIPGIRKAVLSHESYLLLDEFRRFRHFKRYYFDFEYDWCKLDYLKVIYEKLVPLIEKEFDQYIDFLWELTNID